MEQFIKIIADALANPQTWGGVLIGSIGTGFVYHMGWVVSGKVAERIKDAQVNAAIAVEKCEAMRTELDALKSRVAPYLEREKRIAESLLKEAGRG